MADVISVLVIEDDPTWIKIITANITGFGFEVVACATNTDEAILAISQNNYHIALVDINLGGKSSGLTLGKIINQNFKKPFIFVTGSVDPELFSSAVLANPSAYLTKPFSAASLLVTMQSAIRNFNVVAAQAPTIVNKREVKYPFFFVKQGNQLKRLYWNDVMCLRSDKNYTSVITKDGETHMIRSSLQKTINNIIPADQRPNFIQINRAEVVQIACIDGISNDEVKIENRSFAVTEGYIKNLKQELHVVL